MNKRCLLAILIVSFYVVTIFMIAVDVTVLKSSVKTLENVLIAVVAAIIFTGAVFAFYGHGEES